MTGAARSSPSPLTAARAWLRGALGLLALVAPAAVGGDALAAPQPVAEPSASASAPAPAAPARAEARGPRARNADDLVALAPGVWLLPGRFEPGRQPDGNSLVLLGSEGLVVIDSGRHADHAEALLAFARRERRPIVAVVNTHWHLDHLGGNLVLRAAEPRLQSHAAAATLEATRTRFADEAVLLARMAADATLDRATRAMVETDLALVRRRAELAPDTVIEAAPAERRIGGRLLRTGVERAVSGGDLWLFDPESRILAVGDFVTLPVPFFDTACAEQWREALSRFEAMPWQRMVPGHGPPLDRAGFQRYGRAFERLLDCAASDQPAAACSRGWVADLGPLLGPGSERVVGGMLAHYLGTRLRVPDAERRRFCAR